MCSCTPGLWVKAKGLVCGRSWFKQKTAYDIFDVEQWQGDAVEGHANARLIAVAPKMYAAILRFIEANDNYDDGWSETLREYANARTECRAALAAVDGK